MISDLLKRIKVGDIVDKAKDALASYPRLKPALLLVVLGLGIYVASKMHDPPSRSVATGKPAGEAQGVRIFDSAASALSREHDGLLAKTIRDYGEVVKGMRGDLAQLTTRVTAMEGSPDVAHPAGAVPSPGHPGGNDVAGVIRGGQAGGGYSGSTPVSGLPAGSAEPPGQAAGPSTARPPTAPWRPARGPSTLSFPVHSEEREKLSVQLPLGAHVKAKMLTGVAAPEGRPYPTLLQLDYAYILPNRHRLDLSGCFMIAKAQGDLSTERLQMQATKLSCVGRDGKSFERDISGFVADNTDNNFAVSGEVVSKQDRVAVMAFLASIVEGVGKAVEQAQTTTQTTALGSQQQVLSGNQSRYLAAGGASNAAGTVANWYLKEAQSLLPTINVNSGTDIWIVMQESVSLPRSYFKNFGTGDHSDGSFSYVTRLLE